jgi:hypothetical protein
MVGRTRFGGGMVWARGREVWMAGRKLRGPESVTMVFRCDNGIFFDHGEVIQGCGKHRIVCYLRLLVQPLTARRM